jgi:Trehalose-6-phosphate synthase
MEADRVHRRTRDSIHPRDVLPDGRLDTRHFGIRRDESRAKEYVASQVDEAGVLVVSHMAGAAEELDGAWW